MSKIVWAKRSDEWIKANPKKGTMYKVELNDNEQPPVNLLSPIRNAHKVKVKNEIANDAGIYVIICEPTKSIYIGESINMGSRMRNHKMNITGEKTPIVKSYIKMREHCSIHGINSFEFKRHLMMPNSIDNDRLNAENKTIWEYSKLGYNIYNTNILGNVYCPDNMKDMIQKLIFLASDNKQLIDRISALIT